jgi:hypothetical protein
MPIYIYENVDTGERVEVVQSMNEEHVYKGEEGERWRRVWVNPTMSIDAAVDPFDNKAFVEKTGRQKGTIGDLWDQSAELSEKRKKACGGVDPIKENFYKEYSKQRGGKPHPDKMKKSAENKHAKVTFD